MSRKLITIAVILVTSALFNSSASAVSMDAAQQTKKTILGVEMQEPIIKIAKADKKEAQAKTESKEVSAVVPVITYTVREGDSLTSIADLHHVTWVRLWQKNTQLQNQDIINVGDVITIPAEDEVLAERSSTRPLEGSVSDFSSGVVYNTASGANAYGWGQCTWYVKNMKPNIGSYWGNAGYSWLTNAQNSGFATGNAPRAGSIGVEYGHVVIVHSVNDDGTINLSEMNYGGGVGVVHYDRRPSSTFIGFIYA